MGKVLINLFGAFCAVVVLFGHTPICFASPGARVEVAGGQNTPQSFHVERKAAFDAVQRLRAATTLPELAAALTNKSAAQVSVSHSDGIVMIGRGGIVQRMASRLPNQNIDKDLTKYFAGFGFIDDDMPNCDCGKIPPPALARGRDMLVGLGPFEKRTANLVREFPWTPLIVGLPMSQAGFRMEVVDKADVKVTIVSPADREYMLSTFFVRWEDGAWRMDLGDPTKWPSFGYSVYNQTPGTAAARLFAAVERHDANTVRRVLSAHPNLIEARDDSGETPIIDAVSCGNYALAQFLISHHASVNAVDGAGNTALMYCAYYDKLAMAELLLTNGAHVNQKTYSSKPL